MITPTDIQATMHTIYINKSDNKWYMDTAATFHMTTNGGNLTSYFNMSTNYNITIGNDHIIPIVGCGNATLPKPNPSFNLNNILHVTKLIENLISV